ncbi:MAG: AAA family ATPase [Burkholderiaceae bacterium]
MSLIERAVARLSASGRPLPSFQGPALVEEGIDAAVAVAPNVAPAARSAPALPPDRSLGAPVSLPLARMRETGLLIPAARATQTGQEFRLIKGAVLEAAIGAKSRKTPRERRIAVASALPGEGKTFCAINLAVSIVSSGEQPVLLIDADMIRPSIDRHLDVGGIGGLVDAMKDESSVFPLIRPTDIPGLHVLPAGASLAHAGEYLASRRIAQLLDAISAVYPEWIVVLDTPPLLAVTEVRSLIKHVGQVLLVVEAGGTTRRSIQAALATLPEGTDTRLVLNKASSQRRRYDNWYGY